MAATKSIKKNFTWQLIIEIINMLLPLMTSPIIARSLGPEQIGVYSYVFTIVNYFALTAALGIFQYGTREIALFKDNKEMLNRKFSELFYLELIIGIVITSIYGFYVAAFAKYKFLFIIEVAMLLGTSTLQISWLFSGLEDFKLLSIKNLIVRLIGFVCIILFVKTTDDLPIYALILSLEALLGSLVFLFFARKRVSLVRVKLSDVFSHFKGVAILFIPILATFLYNSMDKVMLANMSTMTQLGFYENAGKAMITKNLAVAVSIVLVPRMSNLITKSDFKTFNSLLYKAFEAVLILSIAFGLGTAAISDVFSKYFWGDDFIDCSPIIKIMSFTIPAYGMTYVVNNQILVPLKKEKIYVYSTILGVILNLILNIYFIRRYEAIGAAFATLITQYFILFLECFFVRKEFNIFKSIVGCIPYMVIGAVMYISVRITIASLNYSLLSLVVSVIIGMIVFGILCVAYWVIKGKDDYLSVLKRFRKRA